MSKNTPNGQQEAAQKESENTKNKAAANEFAIQRIYTKDISFEAPNTPHTFRQDWQPEVKLDIHTKSILLEQNIHEVVLTITATAKLGENTAFLAEVHQAGIFTIALFPDEQIKQLLNSYCPSILFPYAREVISDLIIRGGFPPLYLAPINFDVLYQQHLQAQANQTDTTKQ